MILPVKRHESGVIVEDLFDLLQNLGALCQIGFNLGRHGQLVDFRVAIVAAVVLAITGFLVGAHCQKFAEISGILRIRVPADHLNIGHLGVKLIPVLGLGHGLQIDLDVDFGQHGNHRLGYLFIVYVAIVGRDHGHFKTLFKTGFFHEILGFVEIVAGLQGRIMSHVALGALLSGRGGGALHNFIGNPHIVDCVHNGQSNIHILEFGPALLVQLHRDNAAAGIGHQLYFRVFFDTLEILGRDRCNEIDIAGEQGRHPGSIFFDLRQNYLADIAGRILVPVIGESFEFIAGSLLPAHDLERAGAGAVLQRK